MGKNLKCAIKESKTNAVFLLTFLKYLPQILLSGAILVTPMVIAVIIGTFDMPHEMNTNTMLTVLSLLSLPWGIFIGAPVVEWLWFYPEKKLVDILSKYLKHGADMIYLGYKIIPVMVVLLFPAILYFSWLFITNQTSSPPSGNWETLILVIGSVLWGLLVGMPVIFCYILPRSDDEQKKGVAE